MISIFTFTMGRELYLKRLIESIRILGGNGEFEHHVCFQGVTPSDEFSDYLEGLRKNSYPLVTHFWDKNYGTCRGSNKIISQLNGEIILKLDDDAILRSNDFLEHVRIICGLIPNSVFSPFPVGLIGHFGGLSNPDLTKLARIVKYSEENDTHYTLRYTNLVGGLARASLAKVVKRFKWPEDSKTKEDIHFSRFCGINRIPMFYLENALIIEHQESSIGQEQRYGGNMPSVVKKSENPKVSVIVTTYNRENKILNALDSISNQFFKDYEVIIVDDCSTDNTERIVKENIKDRKKFKYFRLKQNHEYHSYPKNYGVSLAKAPYIAFLDDDDIYSPTALSKLYEKAISSKADVIHGSYAVKDEETGKEGNGVNFKFSHDLLLKKNFLVTSSILIKKTSFIAVNGFDENVSRFSDWHLWLRMEQAGYTFDSIPDQVSLVCTNGKNSMSKRYDIYTDAKGNIVSHPYFDITEFQTPSKDGSVDSKTGSTVNSGLVSIVIPVFNRPDLTKVCLDSILKYTSYPFELVLVQEGNDPEVTKLLRSYETEFVHNETPKGFAGAMNSGYELAKGSHICFLNNDIVAIPNWLTHMMEAFERDSKVGLVTPTYTETKAKNKQNIDFNNKEENFTYIEDPMSLKGVCFLISREALDKIGNWDESFGQGGGEDNDICIRISKAGYKLVVARKSFIYHYGSAAFRELFDNDIPYSKKYAASQFQKVRKKWNVGGDVPRVQIVIPCKTGWIWHELALRLTQWSHSQTFKMGYKFYPYLVPHDNARNTAVKGFLEDFWDYLVMIDDDIIPPIETIDELLKADKEIISPTCLTIKPDENNMTFPIPVANRYDEDHKYRPYYGQGIEETDTITGGMFMVKREVYEKIERPFYFTYHKDGTVEYSEDFVFSQQCQSLGYKLYTHYGILCEHMKTIGIKSFNDALIVTANKLRNENQVRNLNHEELGVLRPGLSPRRAVGR